MNGRHDDERRGRADRVPTYLLQLLLVGAGYYLAARFSLKLALIEKNVTPFWPPTGIAVVSFLFFGSRILPAIAGAAFAVNLPISPSALTAGAIAVGNCLAPLSAKYLLRRFGFDEDLARLRDALAIVLVALPSTLVSATIGSAALALSNAIAPGALLSTWSVWWTGDAMGILLVAPVLLTLRVARPRPVRWTRVAEAVALFALLAAGAAPLFTTAEPVWVLLFPILGLVAWRFQRAGAAPAALFVSTLAMWAASRGRGPFATSDLLDKMLGLQAFNAAASLTSLFLATLVAERTRAVRVLEGGYEREHRIAQTLQRSMLPDRLPDVPDFAVAARYVPATSEVRVGGDWYDGLTLPDGCLAIAIGDVAGHGTPAAATMGQLRLATRVYALEGYAPFEVLQKLNGLLADLHPSEMATVVYLHIDPDSGAFSIANAGHPPPLMLTADRSVQFVDGGLGPPVGASRLAKFSQASGVLPLDATLILFTDGLVEHPGAPIDDGLRRLREIAGRAPTDPADGCAFLIDRMRGGGFRDDVALVMIRRCSLAAGPLHVLKPAVPGSVPEIRRLVRRWLAQRHAAESDIASILVATCEACTNVIQHAYGPEGGVLRVHARLDDGEVVIAVGDDGRWRASTPEVSGGGGRGLVLMRGTMDAVEVASDAGGTEVRMRRRLTSIEPVDA